MTARKWWALLISFCLLFSGFVGLSHPSVVMADPGDAADLAGQSEYPTINPGERINIWIRIRNTGTTTWWANGRDNYGYRGTDEWSAGRGNLNGDVPPGGTTTFGGDVAPQTPGRHRYGILLTHNGRDFGPLFFIDVTVRDNRGGGGSSSGGTQAISFGQPVTGTIAAGGQDRWTFSGGQGWAVRISASGFDTMLSLIGPDSRTLATDDDGLNDGRGGSLLRLDLPDTGVYTIVVAGYANAGGSYRLSTECGGFGCINGTSGSGNSGSDEGRGTIESGQTLNGTINQRGDRDTYFFNASEGQYATIRMNRTGGNLDPFLFLHGQDGGILARDDDSGDGTNAMISRFRLPQTGRYRIIVASYGDSSTGSYSLNLQVEGSSQSGWQLPMRGNVQLGSYRPGDGDHRERDLYAVDLTSDNYAIFPMAPGTVVYAEQNNSKAPGQRTSYGYVVVIDHGGGLYSIYTHLAPTGLPSVGQRVDYDTQIGTMSDTGCPRSLCGGAHLHFAVRRGAPGLTGTDALWTNTPVNVWGVIPDLPRLP